MINTVSKTLEFEMWLGSVKDAKAREAVMSRLERAEEGNFGDCEPVGDGVSEMRVFTGPGYRIYFVRVGLAAYLFLWGSDKSDQARAIKRAKSILESIRGKSNERI